MGSLMVDSCIVLRCTALCALIKHVCSCTVHEYRSLSIIHSKAEGNGANCFQDEEILSHHLTHPRSSSHLSARALAHCPYTSTFLVLKSIPPSTTCFLYPFFLLGLPYSRIRKPHSKHHNNITLPSSLSPKCKTLNCTYHTAHMQGIPSIHPSIHPFMISSHPAL
ncbi:hypothetical protein HOY80DRAFT_257525 [Tuber brumale]|nr:hypothetical protein HOY80DRAFT_257525 [Tuber brumale]